MQLFKLILLLLLLSGCVSLDKSDTFPIAADQVDLQRVKLATYGEITPMAVSAAGRSLTAYRLRVPGSKGSMIFYGGSGNDTEVQLRVLGPRAAAFHLDLIVFSYYLRGESIPSVSAVRALSRALCDATAHATPGATFAMGHSLGAWFAADVASTCPLAGLVLVAPETTPVEVIRATMPISHLAVLRPDNDIEQLNALLLVRQVMTRTLVVSSVADKDVPSSISRRVFNSLQPDRAEAFELLSNPSHAGYFQDERFWQVCRGFFGLQQPAGAAEGHD